MRKITLVLPDLITGGAQKVMLNLARGFADRQYQVDLVILSAKGELFSTVPEKINLILLNQCKNCYMPFTIMRSAFKLAHYLRRNQDRVIVSTLTGTNLLVLLIKTFFRIKLPVVIREASTTRNLKNSTMRWLVRRLYPKAQHVVAVTREIAREMNEYIDIPRDRISVIHNPVNVAAIQEESLQSISHPWLINKEFPVIIAVGRFIPAKNYENLIEAIAILNKQATIRLIIIGEGPEKQNIASLIKKQRINDRIDLIGYQENPYAYIKQSDLLVVSSVYEGFVNVLLEAMTLGIPVVSTNCPSGPEEILENGRYGQLVPVGDPAALADAIKSTLAHPVAADLLKDRAAEFSVENIISLYIDNFSAVKKAHTQ